MKIIFKILIGKLKRWLKKTWLKIKKVFYKILFFLAVERKNYIQEIINHLEHKIKEIEKEERAQRARKDKN